MSAPTNVVDDPALVAETQRELVADRQCTRCARTYREIDNMGQWRCRYHPAMRPPMHDSLQRVDPSRHTCCATRPLAEVRDGCTPCDHVSDAAWLHEPQRTCPYDVARVVFADREHLLDERRGVHIDPRTGNYLFVRSSDSLNARRTPNA